MTPTPAKASGRARKMAGLFPVLLISALVLELSILARPFVAPWESASVDMMLRWRQRLDRHLGRSGSLVSPALALVAVDTQTQERVGRFGAGLWLSRDPFLRQMAFFGEYVRPSVVAYDILFQDTTGSRARSGERVSESSSRLRQIAEQFSRLADNPMDQLSASLLPDINRLSMEQGNTLLANEMASLSESEAFPVVIGYYLRGGTVDPQRGVPEWAESDVAGGDPAGDEEQGERVPYLRDMAIPSSDVHFASPDAELVYGFSRNAGLPSLEMLDYALLGFVNGPRDLDGVMRRVPLVLGFRYRNSVTRQTKTVFVPSLALSAALLHSGVRFPLKEKTVEVFLGREVRVRLSDGRVWHLPIDERGYMYLNFNARLDAFTTIAFTEVMPPRGGSKGAEPTTGREPHALDGKLVVVGVTATGVDVGNCPIAPNVPLVYVHLTAANNILTQAFLAPLHGAGNLVLAVLLFVLFASMCTWVRTTRLAPATVLFGVAYAGVAFLALYSNWRILPVVGPLLYVILGGFSVLSYRFLVEERAKRKIRGMFATMVSDRVLTFLEENPGSFSLSGHNVETSVFFSDVAGFSGISEKLSPDRLTQFLNAYLTPITDCIIESGGYVDKYIGDGVMAVWGTPYPDLSHAEKACRSALEQQRRIADLAGRLRAEYGVDLRVRMGLASGMVTAGNMGSERKFQFTVIGDVVNLASRLEPANKDFGTRIIVSDTTRQLAGGWFVFRPLARIVVVGRQEAEAIYELVGEASEITDDQRYGLDGYNEAMEAFYSRDWDGCLARLEPVLARIPSDGPSLFLRSRARLFKDEPPAADWHGEYVREGKA